MESLHRRKCRLDFYAPEKLDPASEMQKGIGNGWTRTDRL